MICERSNMFSGEEAVLAEGDPALVLLIGTCLALGAAISGAMQNVLIARLSLVSHLVISLSFGFPRISLCRFLLRFTWCTVA